MGKAVLFCAGRIFPRCLIPLQSNCLRTSGELLTFTCFMPPAGPSRTAVWVPLKLPIPTNCASGRISPSTLMQETGGIRKISRTAQSYGVITTIMPPLAFISPASNSTDRIRSKSYSATGKARSGCWLQPPSPTEQSGVRVPMKRCSSLRARNMFRSMRSSRSKQGPCLICLPTRKNPLGNLDTSLRPAMGIWHSKKPRENASACSEPTFADPPAFLLADTRQNLRMNWPEWDIIPYGSIILSGNWPKREGNHLWNSPGKNSTALTGSCTVSKSEVSTSRSTSSHIAPPGPVNCPPFLPSQTPLTGSKLSCLLKRRSIKTGAIMYKICWIM